VHYISQVVEQVIVIYWLLHVDHALLIAVKGECQLPGVRHHLPGDDRIAVSCTSRPV
jgi:hypothetical protein